MRLTAFFAFLLPFGNAFVGPIPKATSASHPTSPLQRRLDTIHQCGSITTQLHMKGDIKGIFEFFKKPEVEPEVIAPKFETVVIDPDFRVGILFLGVGVLLDLIPYIQWTLGLFTTLLGILFVVQTFRIRFVFDETALELAKVGQTGELETSGENVIVGGANRWNTETIVNYDFFPKGWIDGPVGPILIYFKETQTPTESWNEGPGKLANDPEKVAAGDAIAGQVHFFPAVCNAQQMKEEFEKRGCRKLRYYPQA